MSKVTINISMSLDGYSAGPHAGAEDPMGVHGQRLHDWIFGRQTAEDARIMAEYIGGCGAVLLGCRTYLDAIHGVWGGENPFGLPAIVHCRALPASDDCRVPGFTFVAGDIAAAVAAAREQAADKQVWVMGGARTVQQVIAAGLADEMTIHLAPLLLGAGQRLFDRTGEPVHDLTPVQVIQTVGATHLHYRFSRPGPVQAEPGSVNQPA